MKTELTVHELRPAWSRLMLCRYILTLRERMRAMEKERDDYKGLYELVMDRAYGHQERIRELEAEFG